MERSLPGEPGPNEIIEQIQLHPWQYFGFIQEKYGSLQEFKTQVENWAKETAKDIQSDKRNSSPGSSIIAA